MSEKRLLDGLQQPADLKHLTREQLLRVCQELREALVENVSQTGGHFASNLGTVDLTVALYASYDFPPDKILWDTGHQAYPHKMLTGRLPLFPKLRQYGGISGFLRREESEYDLWGAGHASTALSAAMGFAKARDFRGGQERVVAIVGDAALTSGMAWEALNNIGESETTLHVVLNDNRMSIAENVGAIATYLSKLRARPWFQNLERLAKGAIERLPKSIVKTASGLHHGVTHYIAPEPTGAIFEELGFNYIGPIDGHNLDLLLDIFRNARDLQGPVLFHVITVKGKGYEQAEQDARTWHGVTTAMFQPPQEKIEKKPAGVTYTQAFVETLIEEARQDEKIVAITAAMPDGTGLSKFAKEIPDRFFDVGIAEEHAVTFAAGLAAEGFKPVATIYSTFLQRAFDQILHDVCIQNLPVRFMLDRAGLVGEDGHTHHGVFDFSYLGLMPNMTLLAPRDMEELRLMVRYALSYDQGPIAVRYPRGAGVSGLDWKPDYDPIEYGRAEVLCWGEDLVILAIGSMVAPAWKARQLLLERGVKPTVVNARFAKPVDEALLLDLAAKIPDWLIVEENVARGGLGQTVMELLNRERVMPKRIEHLCVPDRFIEHGDLKTLHRLLGLDAEGIVECAMKMLVGGQRAVISTQQNSRQRSAIRKDNKTEG